MSAGHRGKKEEEKKEGEKKPMSKPPKKVSEQDLIYARQVLDVVGSWFDCLAEQPELAPQVTIELMKNYEAIFDSLLAITQPKFRVIIYDLGTKALTAMKQLNFEKTPTTAAEDLGKKVNEGLAKVNRDLAQIQKAWEDYSRGLGFN